MSSPLDADNRLRPGFVEPALQILDAHPEIGVIYGDRHDFGLRSEVVDVPPFNLDEILPFNFIDACALLRKEVWSACGGYDPALSAWEDWDLWLSAVERGWQFHHVPGEAFDYRVRPDSMVSLIADEELRRSLFAHVIAKHRDLYWRRLPETLIAAQRSAGALFRLSREQERLNVKTEAVLQDQAARLESAAAERESLEREVGVLRAELEERSGQLLAERDRLLAELGAYRARVSFMEGTRAWRLRNRLLRLRGRPLPAP